MKKPGITRRKTGGFFYRFMGIMPKNTPVMAPSSPMITLPGCRNHIKVNFLQTKPGPNVVTDKGFYDYLQSVAMIGSRSYEKSFWVITPLLGIIIFTILYFIAALLYPGGHEADRTATGFSWLHNYWCNLLNEKALNGKRNDARPFAMLGMGVLCLSMVVFWYQFSRIINFRRSTQKIIQLSGAVAACTGIFIFTGYHDLVINLSGLFALFAFAGVFSGLYRTALRRLFWLGIFIFVLIGVNNVIYYTHGLLTFLPVVQKITFLCFLLWISLIDFHLYKIVGQRAINHKAAS